MDTLSPCTFCDNYRRWTFESRGLRICAFCVQQFYFMLEKGPYYDGPIPPVTGDTPQPLEAAAPPSQPQQRRAGRRKCSPAPSHLTTTAQES